MWRSRILALASIFSLMVPVAGGVSRPGVQQANEGDILTVARAEADFACDLFRVLALRDGNVIVSPLVTFQSLSMLHMGARGETHAELSRVILGKSGAPRSEDAVAALADHLELSVTGGAGQELALASALWAAPDASIRAGYRERAWNNLGSDLRRVDFARDPPRAVAKINAWIAAATRFQIPRLFREDDWTRDTRFVFTSAVYFRGIWSQPFDENETRTRPFHLDGKRSVPVPTMHQRLLIRHHATDEVELIELPYKGQGIAMLILLPKEAEGMSRLVETLSYEKLAAWTRSRIVGEVDVALPRFTLDLQFELADSLRALGLERALGPSGSDYSGIAREGILVTHVRHGVRLEVDEKGTVAAAAEGMGYRGSTPKFLVNRPFVFLIRDDLTGAILFIGRVNDPR